MALMASTIASALAPPIVIGEDQSPARTKYLVCNPVGFKPMVKKFQSLAAGRSLIYTARKKNASLICAAALNSTCAEGQTQTVTRQSSTITVAPIHGKEKSPELDDGGTGLPPGDDGDGGGGGGGGGGNYSGGFFFFAFLAFLGLLKDQESEGGSYEGQRRRRRR